MSRAEAEVILSAPHSCPPHSFTAPSLPRHNPSIFQAPAARAIKLWKIKTKERKKYNMFAQICLTSVRALLPTNRVCETLIGWPAYTCLSWQPPPGGGGRETHREREKENWDLANVPRLENAVPQTTRCQGEKQQHRIGWKADNSEMSAKDIKWTAGQSRSPHTQSAALKNGGCLIGRFSPFLGLWMNQVRVSGSSSFSCLNYWCGIPSIFFIGHPWGNVMVCVTVVLLCYKGWFTEALTRFVILIGRFRRNPTAMFTSLARGSGVYIPFHDCFVPLPHK